MSGVERLSKLVEEVAAAENISLTEALERIQQAQKMPPGEGTHRHTDPLEPIRAVLREWASREPGERMFPLWSAMRDAVAEVEAASSANPHQSKRSES